MSSVTFDTFTAVHLCSSSLVHTCHLYDDFSVMLTTRAFDQRRLRWFAPCSCKPSAMDLPSSLALLSTAHSHSVRFSEIIQYLVYMYHGGHPQGAPLHRNITYYVSALCLPCFITETFSVKRLPLSAGLHRAEGWQSGRALCALLFALLLQDF